MFTVTTYFTAKLSLSLANLCDINSYVKAIIAKYLVH